MTTQEFVKQEVEKELNGFPNGLVNLPQIGLAFSDGLTKGLEIAKDFAEFISKYKYDDIRGYCSMFNDGSHGKAHISPKYYTIDELLTIFLTEKYGNNG